MHVRSVLVGANLFSSRDFFTQALCMSSKWDTKTAFFRKRHTHVDAVLSYVEITTLTEFYSSESGGCLDSLLSNAPLQRFLHECTEMFHTMNLSRRIHDTWSRQQAQGDSLQCHIGVSCACAVTGGGVLRSTYINWCVLYRQPYIKSEVSKADLTAAFNTFTRVYCHS